MTTRKYRQQLEALFRQQADPELAGPMAAYLRGQFPFLGIRTPERRALLAEFVADNGLPSEDQLAPLVRELWEIGEREFCYAAFDLMKRARKLWAESLGETLEWCVVNRSWWDTVDALPVGDFFQRFPNEKRKRLPRWRKAGNIWLRRSAILFQLTYKEKTDFSLLGEIISENIGSGEFFIDKAIGWALRQHARTDPDAVRSFVARTQLSPLSRREALKHLS